MDTTTLLIILVVILLLGGGWYGRGLVLNEVDRNLPWPSAAPTLGSVFYRSLYASNASIADMALFSPLENKEAAN